MVVKNPEITIIFDCVMEVKEVEETEDELKECLQGMRKHFPFGGIRLESKVTGNEITVL